MNKFKPGDRVTLHPRKRQRLPGHSVLPVTEPLTIDDINEGYDNEPLFTSVEYGKYWYFQLNAFEPAYIQEFKNKLDLLINE